MKKTFSKKNKALLSAGIALTLLAGLILTCCFFQLTTFKVLTVQPALATIDATDALSPSSNSTDFDLTEYLAEIENVPRPILQLFLARNWCVLVDDSPAFEELYSEQGISAAGLCDCNTKTIFVRYPCAVLHEFGHFLDDQLSYPKKHSELYLLEAPRAMNLLGDYCTTNSKEYFSEYFEYFICNADNAAKLAELQTLTPETFQYFRALEADDWGLNTDRIALQPVYSAFLPTLELRWNNTSQTVTARSEQIANAKLTAPLISFTASGVEYTAEEDMLWKEWLASEYNTTGLSAIKITTIDNTDVYHTSTITPGGNYILRDVHEITDTWAQIAQTIADGTYIQKYSIGDYKTMTLTTGEIVTMQIVAFDADNRADGSVATITWVSTGLLHETHYMNASGTNEGGWASSDLRAWLQGDVFATLPEEVRNMVVTVDKTYYDNTTDSTLSVADTLWIPSEREVFGTNESRGPIYKLFSDPAVRHKQNNVTGEWWMRSAASGNSNAWTSYFMDVSTTCPGVMRAQNLHGVVLAFCT